jgi:glycerol-3-phosphate cytidylyltransferase
MQLVYIPGVFDLLHVGHLTVLERAKALGDKLIVGVPSDEIVKLDKGTRPIIPLGDRLRMLTALKCVDVAIAYYSLDFTIHLIRFMPDIMVVGDDWGNSERHVDAEKWIFDKEKRFVRLPRYLGESTTSIKQRVRDIPSPSEKEKP